MGEKMTDTIICSAGQGAHGVTLRMWDTSRGWTGSLTGGHSPHVGGVVLATPRPRSSGGGLTCDLYVIPVHGHKDTEGGAALAKRICVNLNVPIVLTCGIHMDHASKDDIGLILANCDKVVQQFLDGIAKEQ
jgi:hypothetical protein